MKLLSTLYNILYNTIVRISIYIGKRASRVKFQEDARSWSTKINIFKLNNATLIYRIFAYGTYIILTIVALSLVKNFLE